MTSIIRVGQSKFVTVQIDEDSNERIMNCIQTLSELQTQPAVQDIFLTDTKAAFSRMLGAQEVCRGPLLTNDSELIPKLLYLLIEARSGEKGVRDNENGCGSS